MLSFYVSGSPGFVFLNPLSLATDDSRSVLAVKGSLRRFAPWTAAGRSGRRGCLRGKGDGWASAGPDQRVRTSNPRLEFDCRHGFDVRVTPPATTRVYCGASPYCLGKASRAPIWFLTRSPGGYPAMSKMTLLRPLVDECKLHKRAVSQRPDSELVFKGLGVAKRYCRRDSIGDSFLQRRPRAGHPGAAPRRDAPPPQPRPGWKAQLR